MSGDALSAEVTAACNSLGFFDGSVYHLEPHCAETLKDLIRYLRRDDEVHSVRRLLGESGIVTTDLVPILRCHSDDKQLFDIVLRLLVNMTHPALLVYNDSVPTEKTAHHNYLELLSHLQAAKRAFTDHQAWLPIAKHLTRLLHSEEDKDGDVEEEEDERLRSVERMVVLVRNVLHPPDPLDEVRPDDDAGLHDQVIWSLHQSGVLDLVIFMTASPSEEPFRLRILEVLCLVLREQSGRGLGRVDSGVGGDRNRGVVEKKQDSDDLLAIRSREAALAASAHRSTPRNLGGTYVINNIKSISDKNLIYHKPVDSINHISLDADKRRLKKAGKRKVLKCAETVERRSALVVRLILKKLSIEILYSAYNPLMSGLKGRLSGGGSKDCDDVHYLMVMTFFMEFNRHYKSRVELVSETLSVGTFHLIYKYMETWGDMLKTDKSNIPLWSSRLHIALKAYKELLYNLGEMRRSLNPTVREACKVIEGNIWYVVEYREILFDLIQSYSRPKFSIKYLCELIETVHVFLKLIGSFSSNKKLFVQRKVKGHRRHKPTNKSVKKKSNETREGEQEEWERTADSVLDALRDSPSSIDPSIVPYDPVSQLTTQQQKLEAMGLIAKHLKSNRHQEAIALLRASREIWPENDSFGKREATNEEELEYLKEIYLANIDLPSEDDNVSDERDEEEEEIESSAPHFQETALEFTDLVKSLARGQVVEMCGEVLKHFSRNTPVVNHAAAKLLHRIAWDLKMPALLFQATLFRTFQRILSSPDPAHDELGKLAKFVVSKFVQVAKTNKKVLMETLFWKSPRTAYDLEEGYGSYQEKSAKEGGAAKGVWEEHEEEELKRLHEEYFNTDPAPSGGLVEWVRSNLIKERTDRAVSKKLKELGLPIPKNKKKGKDWSPGEEEELTSLYQELSNAPDVVGAIVGRLSVKKSRRAVSSALLRLGLVSDRSLLRAPRSRKKREEMSGRRSSSGSGSSSSSSDEEVENRAEDQRSTLLPRLSPTIRSILSDLSNKAHVADGVEWLKESLEDACEDNDQDGVDLPLVPLSESIALSLENPHFKTFLQALAIYPPIKHQESYWRVPGRWTTSDLSIRVDLLTALLSLLQSSDSNVETLSSLKLVLIEKFDERFSDCSDTEVNDTETNHLSRQSSSDGETDIREESVATAEHRNEPTTNISVKKRFRTPVDSSDEEITSSKHTSSRVKKSKPNSASSDSNSEEEHVSEKINSRNVDSTDDEATTNSTKRKSRTSRGSSNEETKMATKSASKIKKIKRTIKAFSDSSDEEDEHLKQYSRKFDSDDDRSVSLKKSQKVSIESDSDDENTKSSRKTPSTDEHRTIQTSENNELMNKPRKHLLESSDDETGSNTEDGKDENNRNIANLLEKRDVEEQIGSKKRSRVCIESSDDESRDSLAQNKPSDELENHETDSIIKRISFPAVNEQNTYKILNVSALNSDDDIEESSEINSSKSSMKKRRIALIDSSDDES